MVSQFILLLILLSPFFLASLFLRLLLLSLPPTIPYCSVTPSSLVFPSLSLFLSLSNPFLLLSFPSSHPLFLSPPLSPSPANYLPLFLPPSLRPSFFLQFNCTLNPPIFSLHPILPNAIFIPLSLTPFLLPSLTPFLTPYLTPPALSRTLPYPISPSFPSPFLSTHNRLSSYFHHFIFLISLSPSIALLRLLLCIDVLLII